MQEIETERLILRRFTFDDLDALFQVNSDPDVMKYIGDGKPQSKQQTRTRLETILSHWDKHGFGLCAVVHKPDAAVIGFCGLLFLDGTTEVEVGYRLGKAFWGMGLATEAVKVSLEYGFGKLGLDRIVAVVHPDNTASQKVLAKSGLRYEKDARYYNTGVKYFALGRDEFEAGISA
jgi:RimJ/RimL family protein N-acetyltransferase